MSKLHVIESESEAIGFKVIDLMNIESKGIIYGIQADDIMGFHLNKKDGHLSINLKSSVVEKKDYEVNVESFMKNVKRITFSSEK